MMRVSARPTSRPAQFTSTGGRRGKRLAAEARKSRVRSVLVPLARYVGLTASQRAREAAEARIERGVFALPLRACDERYAGIDGLQVGHRRVFFLNLANDRDQGVDVAEGIAVDVGANELEERVLGVV